MANLSLIVSVLDSHEALRRQLIYLNAILPPDCELILVDDGSKPALRHICAGLPNTFRMTICVTKDRRPWTQPRARNIGARVASGELLLFFDIDHILTTELIDIARGFAGDRFCWRRRPGVLDANGRLVTDADSLRAHGWNGEDLGVHLNSYVIRRSVFESLGGYDENFCGRYGGDDIDFNQRYDRLVEKRTATPMEVTGDGYVFPDPSNDPFRLFHRLDRV